MRADFMSRGDLEAHIAMGRPVDGSHVERALALGDEEVARIRRQMDELRKQLGDVAFLAVQKVPDGR